MYSPIRTFRCFFLLIVVSAFATAVHADSAPNWLQQAASVKAPVYKADVPAVVLLREESVTLDGNGRLVTVDRYAVRVLTRDGRREALARSLYLTNFSQVKDMQAWLVAPDGSVKSYGKKDIVDRILDPDDIYDENRVKLIDASGDSDVGYVFGYTTMVEDKPLFYQDKWGFQDDLPTLLSRYTLTLPDGWKASSITFNRPEVAPQVSGSTYTWEVRDLSPIPYEPMSPSFVNLAPRMVVNYAPADGNQGVNRAFADWVDVSRWGTSLHEPQVIVDDEVAAKAREITAGAKTELEMIRAVGSFVQKLQYISIDIGLGFGNGYKPRPSNVVLARGYGDCKDKANLMRAMLKALKIEAYPIAIFSGDPDYVRKEWPSPAQFNHCIIAIKVSDQTNAATVITHPKLGRLMIFDATDEYTPVGDLPDYLQGSKALLMAGDNGGLIEMPVTPPDFNSWNRETEVTLADDGGIKGVIRERVSGQEARYVRGRFRSMAASDFSKSIERWLTRGATAAHLTKLSPQDRVADAAFDMDVEFAAPMYAQLMQNRLLVFKPTVADRSNSIYLTEKDRKHPVLLDSSSFSEKVTFNLPAGFAVDEMPNPVKLETPFGKYSTTYNVQDGKLVFTRSLVTNRGVVSVDHYGEVRDFFSKMRDAEQSPVVLVRK